MKNNNLDIEYFSDASQWAPRAYQDNNNNMKYYNVLTTKGLYLEKSLLHFLGSHNK